MYINCMCHAKLYKIWPKVSKTLNVNVNAFIYHYNTTLYMYVQLYARIQKHYSEFF